MKHRLILIQFFVLFSSTLLARDCFPTVDRDLSISGDCDEISSDCQTGTRSVSTFIRPRSITSDLTYRNGITFYQRFRADPSCAFFTYDSAFIIQQTRKSSLLGRGFFGSNPQLVAQFGAPVNSLNLGLSSSQPEGFLSTVRLSPKRKLVAWLPQFIFNLECLCDCLWADIAFAVVNAKHQVSLFEQVVTFSDDKDRLTVTAALDQLGTFPLSDTHTGVDDIEVRLGYTVPYCEDDLFGFYFFGSIPTGSSFDNSQWFQPLVGTKSGGIGAGFIFDSTLWYSEFVESECLLMTELKYRYLFSHCDKRMFDLTNGPLSRFLLVAPEDDPNASQSATTLLRRCVSLEPYHTIDWWIALHYRYCAWGLELGYNLWYQAQEHIRSRNFDFENFGIFDMTRTTNRTSHSKALISDGAGEGTPDPTFVTLTSADVKIASAQANKALSHTVSGAISYLTYWCDYPISASLAVRYEAAGHNRHSSTLESWGLFCKLSMSY